MEQRKRFPAAPSLEPPTLKVASSHSDVAVLASVLVSSLHLHPLQVPLVEVSTDLFLPLYNFKLLTRRIYALSYNPLLPAAPFHSQEP